MDFYKIRKKDRKDGYLEIYPEFVIGRFKDLMIRGKAFYAIWDRTANLWSTDEYDVQRLMDEELYEYAKTLPAGTVVKDMGSYLTNSWKQFRSLMRDVSDNSHQLDQNLTFANSEVKQTDYVSRRLPYALEEGPCPAWDELVGTLYSKDERAKIEWAIGSVVAGDSKYIQKFMVFYGKAGTGKSTILGIIEKLFEGYCTSFEAKELGSGNSSFAMEPFRENPLVAIQHDGDLSKIDDNTRLNSIIAHEPMTMNEKYKPKYTIRLNTFLFMGTNQPVRISDAKSGIIRRLIDIHPSNVTIPNNHYNTLMAKIDFELGAIAWQCRDVYLRMGKNAYQYYRPTEMMYQTDVFYNFIESFMDVFKAQDGVSLQQAWDFYKEFCSDTGIDKPLQRHRFRSELRNYFDEFHERAEVHGAVVRSYYQGFNANKFKIPTDKKDVFSLVLDKTESLLDVVLEGCKAQYHDLDEFGEEKPALKWKNVKTTLATLDTSKLHYVQIPEKHIVIDFDLKDVNGVKSLERNLEAASSWPPTYAELSQGGNGIHLHYMYPGDVTELSSMYSDGIEVKTLLGDASLRRRLTKCNNVDIATLNIRLAVKEKKVLSDTTIKSEKGLRDLIQRNLRKEIHPGTKPSIDFIKKILDDAYESGMAYDVSDLRGRILSFAASSTNKALLCIKVVQQMKFASEVSLGEMHATFVAPDLPVSLFDVEVYPNLFVVCWKYRGGKETFRMINPDAQMVEALFKLKLVGFNNRRYDNHILWARYLGYNNEQLFKLSQRLVVENDRNATFGEAYDLSYADIWDFSSKKQGLKKFGIELGMHHVELDLPWDQPVPEDMWDKVVEYCVNDVELTEATFEDRYQDFVARQILADLSGLSVNQSTQRHTARIIFGTDKDFKDDFVYTDLSKQFPGYKYDMGVSSYRDECPSEGGYVYAEPGMYENVAVLDVASMHPASIEALNLFGPYTKNFSALKDARIAIKRRDLLTARKMLNGKLTPYLADEDKMEALAYALKIVINIVYGLTSARFDNPFKDKRNKDNIVAKRGALFMIDLKYSVQDKGFTVAHIKTDSIKIPNATEGLIGEIIAMGEAYGYDFENEGVYEKFCLTTKADFIARKDGVWTAVGATFSHPYVYKTLFSKEAITFQDLCEAKSVLAGAMYLDFEHDRPMALVEGMHFVGRTGVFVPVKDGTMGARLYRVKEEKIFAVSGTKGYLWVEAEMAKAMGEDCIDMSYFEKMAHEARKTISSFGDFEEFVR